MTTNENDNNVEPMFDVIPDEPAEWFEGDEDIYIDNAAVFTLDFEANQLVIYFGGDRNAIMELDNDQETAICEKVLADPNFWANFLGSFSAALKKSA